MLSSLLVLRLRRRLSQGGVVVARAVVLAVSAAAAMDAVVDEAVAAAMAAVEIAVRRTRASTVARLDALGRNATSRRPPVNTARAHISLSSAPSPLAGLALVLTRYLPVLRGWSRATSRRQQQQLHLLHWLRLLLLRHLPRPAMLRLRLHRLCSRPSRVQQWLLPILRRWAMLTLLLLRPPRVRLMPDGLRRPMPLRCASSAGRAVPTSAALAVHLLRVALRLAHR